MDEWMTDETVRTTGGGAREEEVYSGGYYDNSSCVKWRVSIARVLLMGTDGNVINLLDGLDHRKLARETTRRETPAV
jgi:hypothetical protein